MSRRERPFPARLPPRVSLCSVLKKKPQNNHRNGEQKRSGDVPSLYHPATVCVCVSAFVKHDSRGPAASRRSFPALTFLLGNSGSCMRQLRLITGVGWVGDSGVGGQDGENRRVTLAHTSSSRKVTGNLILCDVTRFLARLANRRQGRRSHLGGGGRIRTLGGSGFRAQM